MNPLARSYSRLKQFNQSPQYNPGAEAVYNRAMSAPTAPNIGGEIIRNILGAYVGSKLGEAKKNYLESEREKERTQRLDDERAMLDYRVRLEDEQRQKTADKAYQGLLGTMRPEAPVTGVSSDWSPEILNEMTRKQLGLLPPVKEAATGKQVTKEIPLGDKTRVYYNDGTFEDIAMGAAPGKVGERPSKHIGKNIWQDYYGDKPYGEPYRKKEGTERKQENTDWDNFSSGLKTIASMLPDDEMRPQLENLLKAQYPQYWDIMEQGGDVSDDGEEDPGYISRAWSSIFGGGKTPAVPAGRGMPSDAKQAPDGKWYVPDPKRPGKYLRVD